MRIVGILVPWCLVGCASSYAIRVDGDVLGSEPRTPREVKAGIYAGPEAQPMVVASGGTLRPVTDAAVAMRLVHDRTFKTQSAITKLATVRVDPITGHFHLETAGRTSDGPVEAVQLEVTSPERESILRQLPVARGRPIELKVLVVLDASPRDLGTARR